MQILSNLTIVILTYNRPEYIKRAMRYWNNVGPIIVILDGSEVPISEFFLLNLDTNIQYSHKPISLLDRINLASRIATTKYAILLSDDEFFIPSALASCILELEKNKDLISCGGRCLGFKVQHNGLLWYKQYAEQKDHNITDEDPIDRMIYHMSNYTPSTIYSITRTNYWSKILESSVQHKYPDPGTIELQLELSFAYFGKSKILPIIMWLRSTENPPHNQYNEIRFSEWWHDSRYKEYKHNLIENLSKTFYSEHNIHTIDEIENGIEDALSSYTKTVKKKSNNSRYLIKTSGIKLYLNHKIYVILKNVYKLFLELKIIYIIKMKYNYMKLINDIKTEKVQIDLIGFKKIEKIIYNFHFITKN